MKTLSMTAQNDNQVNWVFQIELDSTTVRLAINDITLTNHWDGEVLNFIQKENSVEDNELIYGGGLSILGQTLLEINSITDHSSFNSWFNDFYPNNSVYLIGRVVRVGVVWDTATTDSQITWLEEFIITDYSYGGWSTTLVLNSNSEFTNNYLPKFQIQNIYNDGVSYFPADNLQGKVLPLLYGDFSKTEGVSSIVWETRLAPTVLTSPRYLEYKIAYHKIHSITSASDCRLYQLLESISDFMLLSSYNPTTTTDGIKVNSWSGAYHQLSSLSRTAPDGQILGTLVLKKFSSSGQSTIIDIDELQDNDSGTTLTFAPGDKIGIIFEGSLSTQEIGVLSAVNNNTRLTMLIDTPAGTCNVTMKYYTEDGGYSTGTTVAFSGALTFGVYYFGADFSGTSRTDLPFTIEEINGFEYVIENTGALTLEVRAINLISEHIFAKRKDRYVTNESSLRNNGRGRG